MRCNWRAPPSTGGMKLPSEAAAEAGTRASLGYPSGPVIEGEAHARALQAATAAVGDAGMARVWYFLDATSTWLAIPDTPPDLGQTLPPEQLAKATAQYQAVRSSVDSFVQQMRNAYAERGNTGPLIELQPTLPQTLAGAFCVSGVTDTGVDLGATHDQLIQQAMQLEAALFGPTSVTATHAVSRRSALTHLTEMSLCDLWSPHASILVPAAAAAAAAGPQQAAAAADASGQPATLATAQAEGPPAAG